MKFLIHTFKILRKFFHSANLFAICTLLLKLYFYLNFYQIMAVFNESSKTSFFAVILFNRN